MVEGILNTILNGVGSLGDWGYTIIFLAAFLEASAFVGLVVPGETIVVLAGFLSSQGYFDAWLCLLLVILGAILGDSVGYMLGGLVGRNYFKKHKYFLFLQEKYIAKTQSYFRRYGGATVFIGRFIGFLRAMAPFVAGMSQMKFRKFAFYNILGGVIWSFGFLFLGYFFGASWKIIGEWSGRAGLFVFAVLTTIAVISFIRYRKKKEKDLQEAV